MPVADLNGSLAVEISFGDERVRLPLQPAFQRPDEFRAWLVPTRSGTYTFHITGTVKGQPIDTISTCSEKTFDCVTDVSELQFPVRGSVDGTARRAGSIERFRARSGAIDTAAGAQKTAIAAIVVAVLALAAALGLGLRGGRKVV